MSIENEIAGLTQSTTDLLEAVNTKKATLDTAVSNAQTAVTDATSQVSLAAAEKVGAQTARDTAESFKDQAYTYSQSAASAVAYQDLTAIAETKSESAKDVFVYDTTKDSDGGAWRQRTQHTSWYNETLNTATRGSRKEFPAVAVIVAESNKVTIYDGDDPSMPMWMVFIGNTTSGDTSTSVPLNATSSIYATNGLIAVGNADVGSWYRGLWTQDFITDKTLRYTSGIRQKPSGLSKRNSIEFMPSIDNTGGIIFQPVNDVAMTVLPDAPIDPATGLPIPTIAVATDGGVSVIKDDGSVVDATFVNFGKCNHITFIDDIVYFSNDYLSGAQRFSHTFRIPSSDINLAVGYAGNDNPYEVFSLTGDAAGYNHDVSFGGASNAYLQDIEGTNIASSQGYIPFTYGESGVELFAKIASTYNTGWMNGDIKLATLSDTDDTDLVGTQYISNSDFDLDASDWNADAGITLSHATDSLSVVNSSGGYANFYGSITNGYSADELGVLVVKLKTINVFPSSALRFYNGDVQLRGILETTDEQYFTTTARNASVFLFRANDGLDIEIDYIRFYKAEPDRSVNNNGLQVFGTVTREPVATGADLVAYRTRGTDYLKLPKNTVNDLGTEWTIALWKKQIEVNTWDFWLCMSKGDGTNIHGASFGNIGNATLGNGNTMLQYTSPAITSAQSDAKWHQIVYTCDANGVKIYVDGKLDASGPHVLNLDFPSDEYSWYIGGEAPDIQSSGLLHDAREKYLSLLRMSKTCATAEQIEKIYNDEKVLFQEGAQATLYGTSDAVTALAYDDTTELLHVGTSGGRSVFQGLKRVDNTTDAVGTAISASNNLVVEE